MTEERKIEARLSRFSARSFTREGRPRGRSPSFCPNVSRHLDRRRNRRGGFRTNGQCAPSRGQRKCSLVSTGLIISYDGTANDDDALALGKMLARAGFTPGLAYVRHAHEFDPGREELAQHDAEQRLERGAALLGNQGVKRQVAFGASTGEGLGQ